MCHWTSGSFYQEFQTLHLNDVGCSSYLKRSNHDTLLSMPIQLLSWGAWTLLSRYSDRKCINTKHNFQLVELENFQWHGSTVVYFLERVGLRSRQKHTFVMTTPPPRLTLDWPSESKIKESSICPHGEPSHAVTNPLFPRLSNRLTHWGREKMAAILQAPFSNSLSWMKKHKLRSLCHLWLFLWVQLNIFRYCFREWLGVNQTTSHYLSQWWPRLVTHVCATWSQWVNNK